MKYIEKIDSKCKEYGRFEKIDLDMGLFDGIYLSALNDIYKNKSYHCYENEQIIKGRVLFDYNFNAYLDFITDYDNHIFVISSSVNYQGLDYSLIVPESYLFSACFKKFLDVKEKEFKKNVISSNEARFQFKSYMGKKLDVLISYVDRCCEEDIVDAISFYSTNDKGERRSPFSESSGGSGKRKSELMDFDIRCEVLEDSKYSYKIEAFDRNKDEVDNNYVVYCYNLPDKKVRLIAEPISGCKYTKVAYLKQEDMSLEEAKDVSRQLLEYSQSDISDIANITRHQHYDIDKFEKLIGYILGESDDIGFGMKRSIDAAASYEESYFVRKK